MALKNAIFPNSYAVVDNLFYSKQKKMLSFNLVVYSNETKQTVLASLPYRLDGNLKLTATVKGFVSDYPKSPGKKKYILDIGDYHETQEKLQKLSQSVNTIVAVRDTEQGVEYYNGNTGKVLSQEEVGSINADKALFFSYKLHLNKHIIEFRDGEWKDISPVHGMVVLDENDRQLTFDGDSGSWKEPSPKLMLDTDFEEIFGIGAQSENNLLSIVYAWLSERPELSGAKNA